MPIFAEITQIAETGAATSGLIWVALGLLAVGVVLAVVTLVRRRAARR